MSRPQRHQRIRTFIVELNYDGWRLDQFLAQKITRMSRSKARRILAGVRIQPKERPAPKTKPGARLREGDVVTVTETLPLDDPDCPLWDRVRLVARMPSLLVFDKPPGLLVHPTATVERHTMAGYLEERYGSLGRVESVHRLDRQTSGLLVAAIGTDAIRRLRGLFAEGEVDKTYLAVVNDPDEVHGIGSSFDIDTSLGFDSSSRVRIKIGRGDWSARTFGVCRGRNGLVALLKVHMEGGRQHQIRTHLAMLHTPLVGDLLYGGSDDDFLADLAERGHGHADLDRHALHCSRMSFTDGSVLVTFASPLPADLETLMG